MGKQQVISRFFAPKKDSASSKTPIKVAPLSSSSPSIAAKFSLSHTSPSAHKKRTHEELNADEENLSENSKHPLHKRRAILDGKLKKLEESFEENNGEMRRIDEKMEGNDEGTKESHGKMGKIDGGVKNNIVESTNAIGFPAFDQSLHKKFVDKLLARTDESGKLQESTYGRPPSGKGKYTPLEEQVVELKAKYTDVLLMIEVGYKYRFFGQDAENAARVLGIFAHYDHNFLTASIPTFRLHVHVRRLVEAGYKVGVVRQTETAALKAHGANKAGPFTRSLSALYTRATLEAAEALGGGEVDDNCRLNIYLMCVVEQPLISKSPKKARNKLSAEEDSTANGGNCDTMIGVIAVETSTGDVMYGQFKDTVTRAELESCLMNVSPAELLLGLPLSRPTEKVKETCAISTVSFIFCVTASFKLQKYSSRAEYVTHHKQPIVGARWSSKGRRLIISTFLRLRCHDGGYTCVKIIHC